MIDHIEAADVFEKLAVKERYDVSRKARLLAMAAAHRVQAAQQNEIINVGINHERGCDNS